MRVVKCTSCGFACARELPRCPRCRDKTLVYYHTFDTSPSLVYETLRAGQRRGPHPVLSLCAVTLFTLIATYIIYSWTFPDRVLSEDLPKAIASIGKPAN